MPGDGSIAWTKQTDPAVVLVKPRVEGSPEPFLEFLIAEAFVELGLDIPEHFLGFFEEAYREFDRVVPLGPNDTYQVATALYDGWVGLQARDVFADWRDDQPDLADAWQDAGNHLEGRVSNLPREVARGETEFADATELACGAIKHAIELPTRSPPSRRARTAITAPSTRLRGPKTFDALAE